MNSVASVDDNIKGNEDKNMVVDKGGHGETGQCGEENDQKGPESAPTKPVAAKEELDDFGLPVRPRRSTLAARSVSTHSVPSGPPDRLNTPPDSGISKPMVRSVSVPLEAPKQKATDSPAEEPGSDVNHRDACTGLSETQETGTSTKPSDPKPPHEAHSKDVSEWSHQKVTTKDDSEEEEEEDTWQAMPALGEFDVYDDYGRIVARGAKDDDDTVYQGLGGAGKGYTRIQIDEDAQSATSMDENTNYLFKEPQSNALGVEDDDLRDPTSQLEATKDLLTEGQRIAYVGATRLTIFQMVKQVESYESSSKTTRKFLSTAVDSMTKWGQQIMIRLYGHMEINSDEQVMIEQLAEHGVRPEDLVSPLMQNARVKNPLAGEFESSPKESVDESVADVDNKTSKLSDEPSRLPTPPPPYEYNDSNEIPEIQSSFEIEQSKDLDIDLRWTVLCDLFLVLIADATYDARSRKLLELVGESMHVSWNQICRFEKRIIDALEMQQEASKETWDEAQHLESRRKAALKQRYLIMGLATVGGGLVIGLSAGLLAPVIGAGLAAGFTTIGVGGTSAFLGGVGGTALITSGATVAGSTIGIKASNRRTGAVKTFEYRPLHNNKRLNLIVTVSGWMNGKVDDIRLPFSTVDPIMGDIYSVLWEPEMLQSTGQTINILATEALTQGLQQVLGATILTALMASLQLPIVLTKLSYLIDNPWNVSLARANAAGLILADSLINKNLGNRPITLLGFSLGSRLIFSCLKELANKGAFGLVQNVYLFGSPVVVSKDEYTRARSVVSGRFVNGYSSNDWILGYLFRATSGGIMRVAGLAPVEGVPEIENVNVTHLVSGHMAYRTAMPRLLREVGWDVESDEFTEIEDPDPEKHEERQRELMREIDEARRQAELKPDKKRFGFFKSGKLAQKKRWETYDVNKNAKEPSSSGKPGDADSSVLFDIDAIRAELAGEQIEIKQLESTLPPINLDRSNEPSTPANTQADSTPKLAAENMANKDGDIKQSPNVSQVLSPASNNSSASLENKNQSKFTTHSWPAREEEIEMTFDTSYSSPVTSPAQKFEYDSPGCPTISSPNSSHGLSGINPSHNAWADQHDDYTEPNIKMTFQ
ncbi:transmembrane and coiled-coil domain-containing protein 4 [Nannizzia gypsea CBS 118893]|uniref:Transmembrane and coiled-coil domain-containing protein 4 n=1 Tax=Arthroderma gypseum (strain ATCC MYA-4604 / CBS 118893) TaxID=535722 RepID=E4V0I6_ARTGP|nr:transmembrane and coiled-coil domain-containing protein 4 [Nannizzia gypsea CBS 118893]EFR03123.1 transmembrane and coiled-coil domain-containing protein 4 [Nannizzia gypsea CBS 118893]